MNSLAKRIAELEAQGRAAVVVTVVEAKGSTPRAPGAKMLVFADGRIEGTIGGGRIEHVAIETATALGPSDPPRLAEHHLTQELGMCCGGSITLFFEPLVQAPPLIIFGAGHVGRALTKMAHQAGFAVFVADEREEWLVESELTDAHHLHDDLNDPALPWSDHAYVMITTHDHALDQRLVERALKKPHGWLGLIGSRRKAELTKKRLAQKGFQADEIARVRCPVGLAIGAETPAEIAISILGELVGHRRGRWANAPHTALETKTAGAV